MEGLISGVHAGSSTSHPCNQSHIKTNSASLREVVFVHFYTTVQLLKMKVTFQQSTHFVLLLTHRDTWLRFQILKLYYSLAPSVIPLRGTDCFVSATHSSFEPSFQDKVCPPEDL